MPKRKAAKVRVIREGSREMEKFRGSSDEEEEEEEDRSSSSSGSDNDGEEGEDDDDDDEPVREARTMHSMMSSILESTATAPSKKVVLSRRKNLQSFGEPAQKKKKKIKQLTIMELPSKSSPKSITLEASLRKTATAGVCALFNAILDRRKNGGDQDIGKEGFISKIRSGTVSGPFNDGSDKKKKKSNAKKLAVELPPKSLEAGGESIPVPNKDKAGAAKDEGPRWVKDSYMKSTGKGWDQDVSDTSSSSEGEGNDDDF